MLHDTEKDTLNDLPDTYLCEKENREDRIPDETSQSRTSPTDNVSLPRQRWLCVLGCALAHFVLGGFERSNGVLYLHIQERFGVGASETAWVISLSVTLKLLFGPVASLLCTKLSPRTVVIIGALLFTLGVALSGYVPQFTLLFLTYGVITGIGKSLAYQPGLVVVGQHFARRRGAAVGLATAGGGIGTLILPPLFEFLLKVYGYTGGLLILSGVALHICVSGMLYHVPRQKLPKDPLISHSCERVHSSLLLETEDTPESHVMQIEEPGPTTKHHHKILVSKCLQCCKGDSSKKTFNLALLKRPDFVMFCLGIGMLALSFNSILVFIPPLADSRGLDGVQGAYIMSVAGVFDTIGRIASGFILELKRVKHMRKVLYNVVMFLLACVTFSLPFVVTFTEFCVVAAVFGLLIGTYTSQKSVILVDVVGPEELNSSFGILIFFQGVGTLLGPPVTGIFKDVYDSYADGFYFIGGTTFLGAIILLLSNIMKCNKTKHETPGTNT